MKINDNMFLLRPEKICKEKDLVYGKQIKNWILSTTSIKNIGIGSLASQQEWQLKTYPSKT